MARRSIFATSSGVLLAAVSLASALHGQVPTTLNYQGRLLENTPEQDAVDGAVDVVFSIWSGPATDGAAVRLWSESWTGVTLADGIFSVLLGSNGSPLDPADFQSDPSLFLQLEIDGEILLPRQQLGSAPFAMVDEPANELQDLELTGDSLGLSGSAATVDLSSYRDDTDAQDLSLAGSTLSLSNDSTTVDLSGFLDNTDAQTLGLSGTSLSISGSGSTVNLSGFLDNTDSQNLSSVLAFGNSAGGQSITNVATLAATGLTCPSCVDGSDIASDTIRGNDINDNIYILHVECNGECSDMSLRDACDVIENLRGLSVHAELVDVSCVHEIPSTSANGFVTCDDGAGAVGDNECRAFNLRTLGDIPCIDGTGTDALVTCLETDIAK